MNASVRAFSGKDIDDLKFALTLGVDLIALLFVHAPSDIHLVHQAMDDAGAERRPVTASIEKSETVDDLEAIIRALDGTMVARDDLGVDLPPEQVSLVQERAAQLALKTRDRSSWPPRCWT